MSELSASTQNYLKAIWAAAEWSDSQVTATMLADRLGLKMSTVSEGIRKLQKQNLVHHTPYGAVKLTDSGRMHGLQMVRRHRLIETFLVETLGYSWHEVHEEAEHLEHAVSDLMIERIDELLGRPDRDPHGDPIPSADGTYTPSKAIQLTLVPAPARVVVERIADDDPELLQHFLACGINIGSVINLSEGQPYSGTVNLALDTAAEPMPFGRAATEALYVSHFQA